MSSVIKMDVPESCAACKLSYLQEVRKGKFIRMCMPLQCDVTCFNKCRHLDCLFMNDLKDIHNRVVDLDDFFEVLKSSIIYLHSGNKMKDEPRHLGEPPR